MRIAYVVTRSDAVGGASIHVRDLAREMQARGHETVVFLGGEGLVTDQLRGAGVAFRPLRHLRRAIHPASDFRAYRELRRALRKWRPDLVSAHTSKAGWLTRAACRSLGLPVLYTPHGWTVEDRMGSLQGLVYRCAERIAAPWSSAIVCVCEYERQLALSRHIAPPELLHVIHNGVHDVTPELLADPAQQPPLITCLARFEAPKDHETLIRALADLTDEEWRLDLIGDGPREGEIRALAERLGLSNRVCFRGYQEDPAGLLARAQLFVLSSRSEAFPRSVLEAMRAGLPVVASDVGGVREAIQPGVSGRIVPPGSVTALAEALKSLITDQFQRERFGSAARQIYVTRFRFECLADAVERLYANIIDSRTVSPRN